MPTADRRMQYLSLTAGTRAFALVLLAPPVALTQDYTAITGAIMLASIWVCAVFADGVRTIPPMLAIVVEASLVTFTACLVLGSSPVLLAAMMVPPLLAGLVRGPLGVFEVLGTQVVICAATIVPYGKVDLGTSLFTALFTWLMLGLGLGLLATFIHRNREGVGVTSSYRDARRLLEQFRELSGELVEGLDPLAIADHISGVCRRHLPFSSVVVYAPTGHDLTPLVEGDRSDDGLDNTEVLEACLRTATPVIDGPWVALPLRTEAGVVAVVAGVVMPSQPASSRLRESLDELTGALRGDALKLDTALLFASVQHEATADERRRVARELHDGVAQNLAFLGYLIDDITDGAETPSQRAACLELREALTGVVTELRLSLFVLRNEINQSVTLGQGVAALARHIGSRSDARIEMSTDEGSKRLRREIEAELLRIAQEGITNAVKHAEADLIEVSVHVRAPDATITVRDDGRGLGDGGDDSHGLRIMHERAQRIGATIDIHKRTDGSGTELRVVLAADSRSTRTRTLLEEVTP